MRTNVIDPISCEPLLQRLSTFVDQVSALVEPALAAGADSLRKRAPHGGFALVEHLCHLRDLEREGFVERIHRIVTEDLPELHEIDGSTLAIEGDYLAQDARSALRDWREARDHTVKMLREALPIHGERKGIFGGFGVVTLAMLAEGIAAHDRSHWDEMQALVAPPAGG